MKIKLTNTTTGWTRTIEAEPKNNTVQDYFGGHEKTTVHLENMRVSCRDIHNMYWMKAEAI